MEGFRVVAFLFYCGGAEFFPSSLCLSQGSSLPKSLGRRESSRRADARRLDSCDKHRNEGSPVACA